MNEEVLLRVVEMEKRLRILEKLQKFDADVIYGMVKDIEFEMDLFQQQIDELIAKKHSPTQRKRKQSQ